MTTHAPKDSLKAAPAVSAETGSKAGAEVSAAGPYAETHSRMQQLANGFSGGTAVQRKALEFVSAPSNAVVQRMALTDPQFKTSLTENVFGDGTTYPKIYGKMNRVPFINDLMAERAGNDSSDVQPLGTKVWQFVKGMNDAITYRDANLQAVQDLRANDRNANFGDGGLTGGSRNPWPSVQVNQFPASMRDKVPGYVRGLHNSVSMGGRGYDYRPIPGILFHILK
jgi:hypothetical protein